MRRGAGKKSGQKGRKGLDYTKFINLGKGFGFYFKFVGSTWECLSRSGYFSFSFL